MTRDKQLKSILLNDVLEKRRLDQALNAKEFALLAGISYSTAREWFRLPGFPAFRGVVFWQDFAQWRVTQHGCAGREAPPTQSDRSTKAADQLPPRAEMILREASNIISK